MHRPESRVSVTGLVELPVHYCGTDHCQSPTRADVQPRNWVLASEKRRLSEVRISEKGSRGVGRCRLPLELTSCHSFWPAMPYELANGQSFWTIANWGGVVRQFRLSQGF